MARNLTPFGGRGSCCVYDTCGDVCPSGARYSPDFTFKQLIAPKKIALHDRTLVRRLVLDEKRSTVVAAQAVHQDRPGRIDRVSREDLRRRVRLLLELAPAAAVGEPRFPNGLANSSGLVGRYMNGHRFIQATAKIDDQTFPGQNMTHSLISRQFFRCADRQAVRPPRHAGVGELGGPRSAAARRRTGRCCSATS